MKKLLKDTKLLLFENMVKLNPDFKLTEADDKWIQKAVNPEHKGYCTPMTKSTCTPARKALAKRFKKGIDEELRLGDDNPEDLKFKANKLKVAIDSLLNDEDFDVIDTLYRLLVDRNARSPKIAGNKKPLSFDETTSGVSTDYQKKAELLKEKIEYLFDNNNYGVIDKLDNIITKLSKKNKIGEVKVQQNDTYFETLSATLDAVRERVEKKGYTVDEDEMFTQFGTGGINYLETKRATISLLKNGIPDKRRSVTIAIYRMDSGKYELTAYMN